jgi:hypothetical protein
VYDTYGCGGIQIFFVGLSVSDDWSKVEDIDKYTKQPLNICNCDIIFISWKKPMEGWVKLNCDETFKNYLGLAGCGGLFRNSDVRWIKGYARKIGTCDTLCVIMWGMYLGMKLAWR